MTTLTCRVCDPPYTHTWNGSATSGTVNAAWRMHCIRYHPRGTHPQASR